MTYQVRKGGRIYMETADPNCCYPPEVEAQIQQAGYIIYLDGKRKKKVGGSVNGQRKA